MLLHGVKILLKEYEMKNIYKAFSIITLLSLLLAALPTQTVYAATLTVTNNNDNGPGSLRQAIADASSSGGDTITFNGNYTITLTSGTLVIDKSLTIDGTGHTIVLDGNNSLRVMQISAAKTVMIEHLTIRNGYKVGTEEAGQGGGIYNAGTLTIKNNTFSGIEASVGGGIYNASTGTLTVNDSSFSGIKATMGGGIFNSGQLTINKSTFSGNTANMGGGIYNFWTGTVIISNSVFSGNTVSDGGGLQNDGVMTINDSTFSENSASSFGGGIYNFSQSLTVNRSTFSKNSAVIGGGGILNWWSQRTTVNNSTFSENHSNANGGGIDNRGIFTVNNSTFSKNSATSGAGIFIAGTLNYNNTIIANSTAGGDCFKHSIGTIGTHNNNLVEDGSCTPTLSGDPGLGALADNGGSTSTMLIGTDSPAYNAGDVATCLATDQRGVSRPQSGPCDIGAFEYTGDDTALTLVSSDPTNNSIKQSISLITVTFSKATVSNGGVSASNSPANYLLVERGINGIFDTQSCEVGHMTDDTKITINSANYNSSNYTSTLNVNDGKPLPIGTYRLFVCGTTSINDLIGLELNGGLRDSTIDFRVSSDSSGALSLPKTGFHQGQVTNLPSQPLAKAYTNTDMTLEIPKLGVRLPIVGVPQTTEGWDVSWLGNNAGYLYGSAFPTLAGNTVLTAHVWNANNQPGPFAEIKKLKYGDQFQIQAWGATYTYEVRESLLLTRKDISTAFQVEQYDWVTLVTCESYNPTSKEYAFRRAVRAVLVSVK